jgi:Zn ribbon nucleic-acid-binding protein
MKIEEDEIAELAKEMLELYNEVMSSFPIDKLIDTQHTYREAQATHQGLLQQEVEFVPQHVCPACGKQFNNSVSLYKHRYDNLHEDYHMRYKGKHRCTMCGEDHETHDAFLKHWRMERWHEDHALTIFHLGSQQRPDDEGWVISPSEGALIKRRIKTDENNAALRYNKVANRLVIQTIKHHIKSHAMIVAECYGIPDSGKSWFILSLVYTVIQPLARKKLVLDWLKEAEHELAMEIYREDERKIGRELGKYQATRELMEKMRKCPQCEAQGRMADPSYRAISLPENTERCPTCESAELVPVWRDPQVIVTFSVGQTIRAMRDAIPYDTIVQDEDPDLMGTGRDTTMKRIENLLKTMRVRCINFMFISPVRVKYVENANLVFEVLYKRPPTWETKSAYFDREHVSLGWAILKVLPDKDPRMLEYQTKKIANVAGLAKSLGAESYEYSFEEIQADAERALKKLFENVDKDRVLDFAVQDFIEFMPALGIKDAGYYQNRVAKEMHFLASQIYSDLYVDETDEEFDEDDYEDEEEFPTTFSTNDEDYLKYIDRSTVEEKWIDGFVKYRAKESGFETYAKVAEQVLQKEGASAGYCSDVFKKITGAISFIKGGMFELEMLRLYDSAERVEYMKPRPDFRYPEGLSPQGVPDRVVYLADGSVRICAWKVYDKNASFEIQRKGKPCPEIIEAQELIAKGREVKLVVEGLYKGEFFSKEIDPDTEDKVVTIMKRDCQPWPPNIEDVLDGKMPKKRKRKKSKQAKQSKKKTKEKKKPEELEETTK